MIVIVNRLSKQAHAIPWPNITAKDTAMAFYYWIFPQHGLPSTIISDRGTQFVSYFWQALCETLGIKTLLFTAFHPQTDGQTERTNVIIKMYLHMYVNYMQNDWAWWCPSAEFAYNNHISEVTKCTSFFANSEQHSRMGTESFNVDITLREWDQAQQQIALNFATKMNLINDTLWDQMTQAQTVYEEFTNRRRDHTSVIKQGDMVWLNARNLATERLSKKLSNKFKELFRVIRTIGTHASKLKISEDWGHHDVFRNYLLHLAVTDSLSGQVSLTLFPVIFTEGVEEFEVEAIINSWMHWGHLEFLVQWVRYDRPTYQPFNDVKDATEALNNYFQRHLTAVKHDTWVNYDSDNNDSLYIDT